MKKALAEDIVQSESGSFANSRGESKPARQAGDVSRLPDRVERRISEANQRQGVVQPRVLGHVSPR